MGIHRNTVHLLYIEHRQIYIRCLYPPTHLLTHKLPTKDHPSLRPFLLDFSGVLKWESIVQNTILWMFITCSPCCSAAACKWNQTPCCARTVWRWTRFMNMIHNAPQLERVLFGQTHRHRHRHTQTLACMHAWKCKYTHTHTQIQTLIHTHTHAHTHTHTHSDTKLDTKTCCSSLLVFQLRIRQHTENYLP